jgi:hypothetical protein
MADYLSLAGSSFKPLIDPHLKYDVEMMHRPTTPDNIKH